MGSLLRNAWQSMATVPSTMTAPPSCSKPGTLPQRAPDVSSGVQLQKRQGMDGERSERTAPSGASVHMPGRANGSILSLVNRAVNSNIFMRE